jgi:hypothetical protein
MNKIQKFIDKYFVLYLAECKAHNPLLEAEDQFDSPPTNVELATIMSYLNLKNTNPLIIGSIAVIKHLHVTSEDIRARTYRLTNRMEIFLSGVLPHPPFGWKLKKDSGELSTWISTLGSRVDFFSEKDLFSEECEKPLHLNPDSESVQMDCPVADTRTLFSIKLQLFSPRDLQDLLLLSRKLGIPKNLNKLLSTSRQRKNLTFIMRWIKKHGFR